jgi:hypothetical protein
LPDHPVGRNATTELKTRGDEVGGALAAAATAAAARGKCECTRRYSASAAGDDTVATHIEEKEMHVFYVIGRK